VEEVGGQFVILAGCCSAVRVAHRIFTDTILASPIVDRGALSTTTVSSRVVDRSVETRFSRIRSIPLREARTPL
jgi:hypothetical protein